MRKLVLAVLVLAFAMGSAAFADTIFDLTVPNDSCSPCAPADTVQVDVDWLSSSTATVTFTAETVGVNTYSIFALEFGVTGSFGISKYIVTGGSAAGTFTPVTVTPGSLDSYGTFSEASGTGGANSVETFHDANQVEFFLDGGSWASSANVLAFATGTNSGFYPGEHFDAAGQVRVGTDGSNMDTAGFEAASVPEPTSVVLFGSVLLGLGAFARKRLSAR